MAAEQEETGGYAWGLLAAVINSYSIFLRIILIIMVTNMIRIKPHRLVIK